MHCQSTQVSANKQIRNKVEISCRESHVVPRFVWPGPREGRCPRIGRCAVIWGAAAHTRLGEAGPVIWGPLLWFASRGRGEEGPDQLMGTPCRGQSNLNPPLDQRWQEVQRTQDVTFDKIDDRKTWKRWNIVTKKWSYSSFFLVILPKTFGLLVHFISNLDKTRANWSNPCQC